MLPRLSLALALALVLTVCKSQSASLSDEDLNFLVLRNIVMGLSGNIEYETLTPFGNSNCSSCQDCIANGGICMNDMGNWTEYGPLESLTTLGPLILHSVTIGRVPGFGTICIPPNFRRSGSQKMDWMTGKKIEEVASADTFNNLNCTATEEAGCSAVSGCNGFSFLNTGLPNMDTLCCEMIWKNKLDKEPLQQ